MTQYTRLSRTLSVTSLRLEIKTRAKTNSRLNMFSLIEILLLLGSSDALLVTGTQTDDVDRRLQILEQDNAVMRHETSLLRQQLTTSEAKIQQLETEIGVLQRNQQDVSFFAYLGNSIVDPPNGLTVIFDEVVTNKGSHYDPSQGVFQAPINGTYYFSLVASSPSKNSLHAIHLYIVKNDVTASYLYLDFFGTDTATSWEQESATALLYLNSNDRVWVQIKAVGGHPSLAGHTGDRMHTHFSGFLVAAD